AAPTAPCVWTVRICSVMVRRWRLSDSLERDDLLITPPLPDDVSVMDWHRHAELAERAYDHTAKIIADHRARGRCFAESRIRALEGVLSPDCARPLRSPR